MNKLLIVLVCGILIFGCNNEKEEQPNGVPGNKQRYALVIHGGAGEYPFGENVSTDSAYIRSLIQVIRAGDSMLRTGSVAIDVVEFCIRMMEDDTLFNAGRGSVLNEAGVVSMDASIMNGSDEKAGAVAGLNHTRNPISAARRVMDSTAHVFLSGAGAETFAAQQQLEQMPASWFLTTKSYNSWKKESEKFGTVGCVVLDKSGNIASGTSTGGMTMKKWGRIGDSPIIGAGTYASNEVCGISCTGHGEFFIRNVVAYNVAARMKFLNETITAAADTIIMQQLMKQNAKGGLIGIDTHGNICMTFNTPSMFRAFIEEGKDPAAFIK